MATWLSCGGKVDPNTPHHQMGHSDSKLSVLALPYTLMSSAWGKQRPVLSSHKTSVAFNNFLIFGLNRNGWLCPVSTRAEPTALSLSTPPSWAAPRGRRSRGALSQRRMGWEEVQASGKREKYEQNETHVFKDWFFSILGERRPASQHCSPWPHGVLSPATSRELAEASSWV